MTAGDDVAQWRVEFDAEVDFSNGGGLQIQGFRLDIPGAGIDDEQLAELLVRHLGLLMVGEVRFTRKELVQEPHKGSRGVEAAGGSRRVVDLGEATLSTPAGPDLAGLVDLPGILIRVIGGSETVDRPAIAPFEVRRQAVIVHGGGRAELTDGAVAWLVEHEAALVGTDADTAPGLRGAGIPAITGLGGLDLLPPNNFRLHAVPFPSRPGTSCPIRAHAVIDGD